MATAGARSSPPIQRALGGILTNEAKTASGRFLLQSDAPTAARHQINGGPVTRGVRLHFQDTSAGAPLIDIAFCDDEGNWRTGTDRVGKATLQAMAAGAQGRYGGAEVLGVRVLSRGRTGPHDPSAKVTGLQLCLADGVLLPDLGFLPRSIGPDQLRETPSGHEDTPAEWMREYWLPADTRFAGLSLATGWPLGAGRDDNEPCITDLQVLYSGWLTGNSQYNVDSVLNWATPECADALGPPGLFLRAQTTHGRHYGVVDVGAGRMHETPGVATCNNDFTHEAFIATGGRPIVGIYAMGVDHQGVVDLSFVFGSGSITLWAFHAETPTGSPDADTARLRCFPTGAKLWSHMVPQGHWATGLGLRTQHHFGIVDVILKVSASPVSPLGSYMASPASPTDPPPWEFVLGPAEDSA